MNLTLIELKPSLTWKILKGEIIPWSRTTNNCNLSYHRVMGPTMNLINGTHNIVTCFEGFDPRNNFFQRFLLLVLRVLTLEKGHFFLVVNSCDGTHYSCERGATYLFIVMDN
jgi:putative exporter of polyketide antibiotics